jgi:starch synthase
MTGALPRAWSAQGHEVLPVLPLYGNIDTGRFGITKTDLVIAVPLGHWIEYATVYTGLLPNSDCTAFFLRSAEYFDRPGIYGYHDGFADNDRRFIFLSRAAFELARALGFRPDVVHAHDYHTAPTMPMLRKHYQHMELFSQTAGVFTIHNMAYQGVYEPSSAMDLCGFPQNDFYASSWFEHDNAFNAMKAGIMFADKVTTVSPSYAQEIRWTPEGMGLQDALQSRGADIVGVLNGIDHTVWDPSIDADIPVNFTPQTLDRKEASKRGLLMSLGLTLEEASDGLPLFGMVSRLTDQKGLSLMTEALERFVAAGRLRFVLLGSGERRFEDYFHELALRYPKHVFSGIGYNEPHSHRIQAASDFYLMPSKFEPCGLTQMFALAYASIPIVRAIGGLNDTVVGYDPVTFAGNGIRFNRFSAEDLAASIEAALHIYRREPHWTNVRRNAMASDHTIERTAASYINVFNWAMERQRNR